MRAGHRGIFDDGDRRIGGAQHVVAERARRHAGRPSAHRPEPTAAPAGGAGPAPEVIAGRLRPRPRPRRSRRSAIATCDVRARLRLHWSHVHALSSVRLSRVSLWFAILKHQMWQCRAGSPKDSPRRHDCLMAAPSRASALRRFVVADIGQLCRDPGRRFGVGTRGGACVPGAEAAPAAAGGRRPPASRRSGLPAPG